MAKKEQMAAEAAQKSDSMAITEMQTQAQLKVSEDAKLIKQQAQADKREKDIADIQLRLKQMEDLKEIASGKAMAKIKESEMNNQAKAEETNKGIALELSTNDKV